MSTGSWGVACRQVNFATHGYRYWCLFEMFIPTAYPSGSDGANFALPIDMHAVGGENGWTLVSPMHVRYENGNLVLQHQPNIPAQHEFTVVSNLTKNVWHSVLIDVIFGRSGLSVPGHPNGNMGRTRIWMNGTLALNTGNVNNCYGTGGAAPHTNPTSRLTCLEGHYSSDNPTTLNSTITAQRWGTTLAAAMGDSSIVRTGSSGSSFSVTTSRQSNAFVLPSPLPS